MKIGLAAAFGDSPLRDIEFLKGFAIAAESCGFNSLWAPEHIVFFPTYQEGYPYKKDGAVPWKERVGLYDPLLVCAVAACVTTRLRLGTTVLVVPERPPLLTAKEIMTLDHIAPGRFEFGAGLGWSKAEYAALGVPWERRGKRFDEYLDIIKMAWTADVAEFHGEFAEFEDVLLRPFPLTEGGPPILIGGNSDAAIRRSIRIGDGWYGVWMGKDDPEPLMERVYAALAEAGRSPDDGFRVKLNLPWNPEHTQDEILDMIERVRRLGVHEFVVQIAIRAKTMESDMAHWSGLLGLSG